MFVSAYAETARLIRVRVGDTELVVSIDAAELLAEQVSAAVADARSGRDLDAAPPLDGSQQ